MTRCERSNSSRRKRVGTVTLIMFFLPLSAGRKPPEMECRYVPSFMFYVRHRKNKDLVRDDFALESIVSFGPITRSVVPRVITGQGWPGIFTILIECAFDRKFPFVKTNALYARLLWRDEIFPAAFSRVVTRELNDRVSVFFAVVLQRSHIAPRGCRLNRNARFAELRIPNA